MTSSLPDLNDFGFYKFLKASNYAANEVREYAFITREALIFFYSNSLSKLLIASLKDKESFIVINAKCTAFFRINDIVVSEDVQSVFLIGKLGIQFIDISQLNLYDDSFIAFNKSRDFICPSELCAEQYLSESNTLLRFIFNAELSKPIIFILTEDEVIRCFTLSDLKASAKSINIRHLHEFGNASTTLPSVVDNKRSLKYFLDDSYVDMCLTNSLTTPLNRHLNDTTYLYALREDGLITCIKITSLNAKLFGVHRRSVKIMSTEKDQNCKKNGKCVATFGTSSYVAILSLNTYPNVLVVCSVDGELFHFISFERFLRDPLSLNESGTPVLSNELILYERVLLFPSDIQNDASVCALENKRCKIKLPSFFTSPTFQWLPTYYAYQNGKNVFRISFPWLTSLNAANSSQPDSSNADDSLISANKKCDCKHILCLYSSGASDDAPLLISDIPHFLFDTKPHLVCFVADSFSMIPLNLPFLDIDYAPSPCNGRVDFSLPPKSSFINEIDRVFKQDDSSSFPTIKILFNQDDQSSKDSEAIKELFESINVFIAEYANKKLALYQKVQKIITNKIEVLKKVEVQHYSDIEGLNLKIKNLEEGMYRDIHKRTSEHATSSKDFEKRVQSISKKLLSFLAGKNSSGLNQDEIRMIEEIQNNSENIQDALISLQSDFDDLEDANLNSRNFLKKPANPSIKEITLGSLFRNGLLQQQKSLQALSSRLNYIKDRMSSE